MGRRYGVLPGCDHIFCLECIRGWRGNDDGAIDRVSVRRCPVCRVASYFVVPSAHKGALGAEEKRVLLGAYTANLRKTPCRHFAQGRGRCPFGTSCFYGHTLPDGSAARPEVLSMQRGADGSVRTQQAASLLDFMGGGGGGGAS